MNKFKEIYKKYDFKKIFMVLYYLFLFLALFPEKVWNNLMFLKTLRCYIVKENGHYYSYSLEFCLYAHGDTFIKAMHNIDLRIHEYINDAWEENHKNRKRLLKRSPPFISYFNYYIRTRFDKNYKKYNPQVKSYRVEA